MPPCLGHYSRLRLWRKRGVVQGHCHDLVGTHASVISFRTVQHIVQTRVRLQKTGKTGLRPRRQRFENLILSSQQAAEFRHAHERVEP